MYFAIELISKVIMRSILPSFHSTGCLFPLLLSEGTICDLVWLAWLQLSYWALVFNVPACNSLTVSLLLVLLARDSRILSIRSSF